MPLDPVILLERTRARDVPGANASIVGRGRPFEAALPLFEASTSLRLTSYWRSSCLPTMNWLTNYWPTMSLRSNSTRSSYSLTTSWQTSCSPTTNWLSTHCHSTFPRTSSKRSQ